MIFKLNIIVFPKFDQVSNQIIIYMIALLIGITIKRLTSLFPSIHSITFGTILITSKLIFFIDFMDIFA